MKIAWKFYNEMSTNKIFPDNFTFSILINGIRPNRNSKKELLKAIDHLERYQFKPDEILYNSLMDACVKFGEMNKCLSIFEEMKKNNVKPSSVTYGILIKAYGKTNDLVKAFQIFEIMKEKRIKIN